MGHAASDPSRVLQAFPKLYADGQGQPALSMPTFCTVVQKQMNWAMHQRERSASTDHDDTGIAPTPSRSRSQSQTQPTAISTAHRRRHDRKKSSLLIHAHNNHHLNEHEHVEPCNEHDIQFMMERFFCQRPYRPPHGEFVQGMHAKNWIYATYYLYELFREYSPFSLHHSIQNEWIMQVFICSAFLPSEMDVYCCQLIDIMLSCWGCKQLTKYKFTDNSNNKNKNKLFHLVEFKSLHLLHHCLNEKAYLKTFKTTAKNNKIYIFKIIENVQINPSKNSGHSGMKLIEWFMHKKRFITSNEFNHAKYRITYVDLLRVVLLRLLKLQKKHKELSKHSEYEYEQNEAALANHSQTCRKMEIGIVELGGLLTAIKKHVVDEALLQQPEYNELLHNEILLLSSTNSAERKYSMSESELIEFAKIAVLIRPQFLYQYSTLQNLSYTPLDLAKKLALRKLTQFLELAMTENRKLNHKANPFSDEEQNEQVSSESSVDLLSGDTVLSNEHAEQLECDGDHIEHSKTDSNSSRSRKRQQRQRSTTNHGNSGNHNGHLLSMRGGTKRRSKSRNSHELEIRGNANQPSSVQSKRRSKANSTKIMVEAARKHPRPSSNAQFPRRSAPFTPSRKSRAGSSRKHMIIDEVDEDEETERDLDGAHSRSRSQSMRSRRSSKNSKKSSKSRRSQMGERTDSESSANSHKSRKRRDRKKSDVKRKNGNQITLNMQKENSTPIHKRVRSRRRALSTKAKGSAFTVFNGNGSRHDHSKSMALLESEYASIHDEEAKVEDYHRDDNVMTAANHKEKRRKSKINKITKNLHAISSNSNSKRSKLASPQKATKSTHRKSMQVFSKKRGDQKQSMATQRRRKSLRNLKSNTTHSNSLRSRSQSNADVQHMANEMEHAHGNVTTDRARVDMYHHDHAQQSTPSLYSQTQTVSNPMTMTPAQPPNTVNDNMYSSQFIQTYTPVLHAQATYHEAVVQPLQQSPYYVVDDYKSSSMLQIPFGADSPCKASRKHKESDFNSNDDIVIINNTATGHAMGMGTGMGMGMNHYGGTESPIFLSHRHNLPLSACTITPHHAMLEAAAAASNLPSAQDVLPLNSVDEYMLTRTPYTVHSIGHAMEGIGAAIHTLHTPISQSKQNEMESRIEILENENINLKSDVRKLKKAVRELTNTIQQIMQTMQQQ